MDMKNRKHSDFYEAVYDVVRLIPKGKVTTYGAIAQALGAKSAARMVGWAMNASHGLSDVPAHRVVNREGMLTGKLHFDPPESMQRKLEEEGIKVVNDQVQQFDQSFWNPSKEIMVD